MHRNWYVYHGQALREQPKALSQILPPGCVWQRTGARVVAHLAFGGEKSIGEDIKAVQFGWPLGLPLVDHLGGDVWEVRTKLENRIARVLFAAEGPVMVLLHGFIKKDQKTPKSELDLAKDWLKRLRGTR